MATDPLDSVIFNVPDWLKRLDELSSEIEQRQLDLAKFSGSQPPSSAAKSIRNRGSTESLKPTDDGPALPTPDTTTDRPPNPVDTAVVPPILNDQRRPNGHNVPSTPISDPWTGSSLVRHTNEVKASAQRRARATVRKRQKTDSMLSADGTQPKYRSRRMVIVYYDSYVQSFFEELVKFVSAQRNLMRKAKMAAKVAHIRRLAELQMPEDEDEDEIGELKPGNELIAASPITPASTEGQSASDEARLQLLNSRPYRGGIRNSAFNLIPGRGMRTGAFNGGLGAFNEKGDIWDELDKGLEIVQGVCERAAHQFLRDGDCNEEIEKIKIRLDKVKETAANEKVRVAAEQTTTENLSAPKLEADGTPTEDALPERPHDTGSEPNHKPKPIQEISAPGINIVAEPIRDTGPQTEPIKSRTFRPSTMRRDFGAFTPSKFPASEGPLEIDEGIEVDMDDFKPVYRSTRLMRRPV
ncbi:hypothetical protein F4808DRAFT_388874 [Astrocystis sublimbata]|nr:hypothetical protein F4808DRAFT_388874 [Astrocystis sublimbata]